MYPSGWQIPQTQASSTQLQLLCQIWYFSSMVGDRHSPRTWYWAIDIATSVFPSPSEMSIIDFCIHLKWATTVLKYLCRATDSLALCSNIIWTDLDLLFILQCVTLVYYMIVGPNKQDMGSMLEALVRHMCSKEGSDKAYKDSGAHYISNILGI